MSNITKQDIIKKLSKKTGITYKETSEITTGIIDAISNGLLQNKMVKLSNFGTFILKEKAARVGRNPKTGVEAIISARKTVLFHASQTFKSEIN
ncbi:MAG: integration host factor subunit alpha [Alphaproteobacteria bacterium]|jgi:integration host factor subunit alpha|nr:integration host factor subunit alpha [Alphaproteobacteria bacterium]